MVLRLDKLVEALGELRLLSAAQRGEREVRFAGGARGVVAFLRADGVGAADVPASLSESFLVWYSQTSPLSLQTSLFTHMMADLTWSLVLVVIKISVALPGVSSKVGFSVSSTKINRESGSA